MPNPKAQPLILSSREQDDPIAFRAQVKYICSLHLKAKELLERGIPESQYR